MTGPEDQLRSALHAAAEQSTARPPSAQQLLREHRRHVHRRNAFVPAAGVPWFVALFGRDSLIVSLQTMMVHAPFASVDVPLQPGVLEGPLKR